jgi:plasmid stability protein
MIQIRNVPDDMHRSIKARAALCGMSMSDYILQELKKSLERPTRTELLDRLAKLPEASIEPRSAAALRAERDNR